MTSDIAQAAHVKNTRTTCPYCGVGCGVLAGIDDQGRLSIKGDAAHPANFGRLCSKGMALAETVDQEGRLLYPQVNGRRVSWDEALDKVAREFSKVIKTYGPDAVAFYVSGQLLTEDYYVANKLMKGFIGSANIDTNSRLCMASAVVGYKRAFGSDTVPCNYEDLECADLIILSGSNTAWCHPVIFQRIQQARDARPGLKIIVIDPRRTATCEIGDLHLAIKPGTDVHLFNGLLNHIRREDMCDWAFLENNTEGFSAALKTARDSSPSIPAVAAACHVAEADVAEFYRLFTKTEKVVTVYSQGVNQSSSGTDKVNSIINCHLATGRIGKPGMGPFSITGQPNAMGGREVGGLSNQLAAHMDLENPAHRDTVQRFWNAPTIAQKPGLKAVDLFQAIDRGEIKAVWIMATNPAVSLPDTNRVKAALKKCELVVVSDCMCKTDTTLLANVLLPAKTWGEKDGTVTNSERRISRQRAFMDAPGEAQADWWIICELAKRMGFDDAFQYEAVADIFREHAALSGYENNGVRDFDIHALQDLDNREYQQLVPVQWPIGHKNTSGTERMFADGRFFWPNGKARLVAVTPRAPGQAPDKAFPLILNTGRVRDQWHTMTRTGKSARLSAHITEPYLEIHPQDAAERAIADHSLVKISSRHGEAVARITLATEQQIGSVFMPMHWNEQYASSGGVGAVVNPFIDPLSGQPESKHTPVRIDRLDAKWQAFLMSRDETDMAFGSDCCGADYWVKSKGADYWRYELAGLSGPGPGKDRQRWINTLLGDVTGDTESIEYTDDASACYRFAYIRAGRLEKCLFIAPEGNQLPGRTWLGTLFAQGSLQSSERISLLAGKPAAGQADDGSVICSCFNVGKNRILSCIQSDPEMTAEKIGKKLQAGTQCGSCLPEIKKLLNTAHP